MTYSWRVHSRSKTHVWALLVGSLVSLFLLGGCPKTKRRLVVPDAPETGDKTARSRFQEARSLFKRDKTRAGAAFESIAREYPNDPIAPWAMMYAGISAYRASDYRKALTNLRRLETMTGVDARVRVRGRLFLGLALNYEGKHADALPHLRAGKEAIAGDEEQVDWNAAMAEATSRGVRPVRSLRYYDAWYAVARPAERAYIITRVQTIATQVSAAEARRAYDGFKPIKTLAGTVLAQRVAGDLEATGNNAGAEAIRKDTAKLRASFGLAGPTASGKADANLVGAILPLTGRRSRRGDLTMRGLALAAGTFPGSKLPGGAFTLNVRDSRSMPKVAVSSADALASAGVVAMVGPIHGPDVDAVAARAAALGVPLISLNPRSELRTANQSSFVFHLMLSAEERARTLARFAMDKGVTQLAILRPDNGYGRAVGKAFRDEVVRLGGTIAIEAQYDKGATSFTTVIRSLKAKAWQGVFVPDQARRLELVAPALTAAGLVSRPVGARKLRRGRGILLLSTAEFLSPRYIPASGRYSRGAILAPGFYPDRFDPIISGFVDRYEQAFNRLPTALDAYGYDAALVVRSVVSAGASSRAQVSGALARAKVKGLTGTIQFSAQRRRADRGLLYEVKRKGRGTYVIRALRN